MLRVLLAGLGVRGRHWAQVIQRSERADLVAVVDPSAEALAWSKAEFGEIPGFPSVEAALAELAEVDALVLANPPMGRESIVEAACARNLPMLIEKPLALDLQEALKLVQIAEAGGVSLMIGLNFRYLHVTKATIRLLAEGTWLEKPSSRVLLMNVGAMGGVPISTTTRWSWNIPCFGSSRSITLT